MKKSILNLGKALSNIELRQIKGSIGFGEFGCKTDLDCDTARLRCCYGICLTFDSQYDKTCNLL